MQANPDLAIRNARVVDGTGAPWFYGDVFVTGDTIVAVEPAGTHRWPQTAQTVDAGGRILCPGFIDIQSHSIRSLLMDGRCISKISQGITTEIMGETWTPAPVGGLYQSPLGKEWSWPRFGQWLDAMVEQGVSPNVGSFLAGATVRSYAMGMQLGHPSEEQIRTMQRVVAESMDEGAFGVAYALIYPPDAYTTTAEIVEVCRPAAERGGVYITHLRSEGDTLIEALEEAIEIGRQAKMPVEVYHLKATGRRNWGKMEQVFERIEAARAEGIDITADMYPYPASGTGLTAVIPPEFAADGKLFDTLEDPAGREAIRRGIIERSGDWGPSDDGDGGASIMPLELKRPENQRFIGLRLDAIARQMGLEPADAIIELLRREQHRISTVYFKMSEDNLVRQMTRPWVKFSTDAAGIDPATADQLVHPRGYGTMPRILGRYVREQGILSWEEAIFKMTWQVAQRLSLTDRGHLRAGARADLVLIDPQTVGDKATFEEPHQLSVGIDNVWVNGVLVWNETGHTGALPGQVVRPG